MTNIRSKECGAHKLSPTQRDDKLWNGYLQLNSTPTVSAVAFFKGGEKMPDVKWSRSIVVKGTVKLQDFEKYIQELPLSRTKELMAVSLYCKEESSQVGLEGMENVAKKYVEDGRVGLAKVTTGIDLYVCPPSDTIITILEKYGYLDGSTHFKENKDSLIGCVVWRRNQINHLNSIQKSSRKNDHVQLWSPIRTPSEWSRKNDPIVWSPIRTSPESSRKNDPTVWSPIRTTSESSRKNDPTVWSPIRTPSETSRKIDSSPVWSPIRWPLVSSDQIDISKQRDSVERDKNGSITSQPHLNFRAYYYSDLVKSEDTPNSRQVVSAEVEASNIDLNLKDVGRELVPDVTDVTKQSLPSAILHNESEDDLPEYEFGTSQKRRLDDVTKQSLSSVILQDELENDLLEYEFGTSQKRRLDDVTKQSLSSVTLQQELDDDLPEFDFGTSNTSYLLEKKRLDIVTKQSLSSSILRKELEDDLPEYEFGTLNTSCQTSENIKWEENMEQDMDISPEQSPQKKVCRIDQNRNISSSTTLSADAPPMSPVNASWYPSVQYMNQLNAEVTQQALNIPHFTYLGSVSNSMEQSFIPPFQTRKPDFTYLGPTFTRGYAEAHPQPHAHSHLHAKPRRNDVRIGRDHMTEFNQHFAFRPQNAANKQYQSPGQYKQCIERLRKNINGGCLVSGSMLIRS